MIEAMKRSFETKKGNRIVTGCLAMMMLSSVFSFYSCTSDSLEDIEGIMYKEGTAMIKGMEESIRWADAIVTVKSSQSGQYYFQLDQDTTLEPADWTNPYHKEVRALLSFSGLNEKSDLCSKKVKVEKIDSLITRDANYIDIDDGVNSPSSNELVFLVDVGYKTTSELLSNSDPLEIVSSDGVPDWLSFSEDGYLTIHFATYWGGVTSHSVNLYASKSHPDHLFLVHKNNGDIQSTWSEGLVAFKMFHMYIGRKDDFQSPREITLHWMSFDGEKQAVFKYGKRLGNK